MRILQRISDPFKPLRKLQPSPDQPGRLSEQVAAVCYYLADVVPGADREATWQTARAGAMAHARREVAA